MSDPYVNFNNKDKTVSQPSYLYDGISIPGKTVFTLQRIPSPNILTWHLLYQATHHGITPSFPVAFSASSCNRKIRSACSWYKVFLEGSPTSHMPLGCSIPSRVPWPPASNNMATELSEIWRKPGTAETHSELITMSSDFVLYIFALRVVSANKWRLYMGNAFSHWPKPFPCEGGHFTSMH